MMNANDDIRDLPWKKIGLRLAALLFVAALAAGGWAVYGKFSSRPLSAEQTRQLIDTYLAKNSGRAGFATSLDVSKEKNPWNLLKVAYDSPPDYKTVYRAIGEHLAIADSLLKSSDEKRRPHGARILAELIEVAGETAYDPWLAARMADAYVVPLLELASEGTAKGLDADLLMRAAGRAYRGGDEGEGLIRASEIYLAKFGSNPRANDVRQRLASFLQSRGRKQEAQAYLDEIRRTQATAKANGRAAGKAEKKNKGN